MSKNLKAFLNKNKKKPAKENETKQKESEETKVQDEVHKVEEKVDVVKKDESSDSEVDDQDLDNHQYGKIVENKDVAGADEDGDLKKGFGYDDTVVSGPTKKVAEKEKKKTGDISFNFKGAKPSFNRKPKGKFAEDFSEGLNDMDDDGQIVKRAPEKRSHAEGGREFVNLGSSAKQGGPWEEPKEQKESKGPRKPTFTGRMNLKGAGEPSSNSQAEGVTKSYGFSVTYKPNKTEEEKGEEGKNEKREQKKQRQQNNEKGVAFNDFVQKEGQPTDDDGFQVVRRKDRKKPTHKQADSDSEEKEGEGFKITRGEKRGGFRGGRGGAFRS
uniref:Uncharacterized protein n=1 Tax=Strombidium inclinatum TaxID=197538 RepID=A0A7S3N097_9SPIT|mmetsp:Transcript_5338/g.8227  ORF Transcript_5338/g.8227 Transcript_5338/m.8227 type:complete len:327 (+) Transcript_5338:79-1059(+)|eukprot:CAMPEP_0170490860 /NCGR_PEP_ID=MMETSP0208-20121228/9926_1 /TAXON_ID=197538 /ORGANISM="Strombidium inclinatum, Strain S3" /LENGTH=326 /DNA_ID=CAMNT_0010766331 /DNA_START=62 /DNA_END=1042 /DNA_ORIENTATION=+